MSRIETKDQLISYFEKGEKDPADFRIGTEHERLIFQVPEFVRAPYDGERGIQALLKDFEAQGWAPVFEKGKVIALKKDGASITLEPAGQFELSGAPLENLHQTFEESEDFKRCLLHHCSKRHLGVLEQGIDPKTKRQDMPWMPKARYAIMRRYMEKVGTLGQDMMTATTTVQANLDFSSERDCARKFQVAMALQPIATALFANSPVHEGRDTGFQSYRAHIWTQTDADRSGLLDFAFDGSFSYERYLDYVLSVPMYLIVRDGQYLDFAGASFVDFMDGKLGHEATWDDFETHLTTAFPEVRLKTYLEMRGADGGSVSHAVAQSALWVGLLYDDDSLDAALDMVQSWRLEDVQELLNTVVRQGLFGTFKGQKIKDIASRVVDIATKGLVSRARLNKHGQDETIHLNYLNHMLRSDTSPANDLLHSYVNECKADLDTFLKTHLKSASREEIT